MSAILQKTVGIGSAVTLVTTTETLVAYSGQLRNTFPTLRAIIKGWLQIVYGTNTTGVQLRIRRGNGISGAVVAGGNTETAGVAAAAVADLAIKFAESVQNAEFQDYSLTVQQVAASANGTVNLAMIEAESING
jgi:hypothetical protein